MALAVSNIMLIKTNWPHRRKMFVILLLAVILPVTVWSCDQLSQFWHDEFASQYRLRLNIPDLSFLPSSPREPITICALDWRYYPYFGSHRQHRVCQPTYVLSSAWMMDYLRREKVDFIVQSRDPSDDGLKRFAETKGCFVHAGVV